MCVISMIMDDWNERTKGDWWTQPSIITIDSHAREEIENLKKEIESLKKLLKAAKIYDEETGQPECETAEKIALFKALAKALGIDVSDIFEDKDATNRTS